VRLRKRGGGGVANPGISTRSMGNPSWLVNLYSFSLLVVDTPAFYTPGLGPKVAWDLTYNSIDNASVGSPFNYLLGSFLSCPFLANVTESSTVVEVKMPDGRVDWYYPVNPNVNPIQYTPASGTGIFNTLSKNTTTNVFTLTLKDHSLTYTFALPFTYSQTQYYALTRITDQIGQSLTLSYTTGTVPKLSTITDANGNSSTIVYNSAGQMSQVNDPFGGSALFSYTTINGVTLLSAITDQAGFTSTIGYDSLGRLISITTPLTAPNAAWQFGYVGSSTQVSSVTDALGNKRTYSTTSTTTTKTDELGRQTVYDFSNNSFGCPGKFTSALGEVTQTEYDANRNPLQTINPLGFFIGRTFDNNGNVLTELDYLNPYPNTSQYIQKSWTYDSNNNVLSMTDPFGTQSWTYNSNNLPLTWTDKLGKTTTYAYTTIGLLQTVTDRNGIKSTNNSYNTIGRLISTADALGNTTQFGWDNRGRRTSVTDPVGNVTSFAYDLLDRVTTTTFADNTTITNLYNCCQLTQVTDQKGNVTKYGYDLLSRLTSTTDPTGAVVSQAYDAVGNLVSLTDPNNHTWQWQYNANNLKSKQIDPLGNTETWSYDAAWNLITRVDGNGASTSYQYDALNRLTLTTYPDSTTVSYTYDDLNNRLTATNTLGTWTWTYNANSWTTSEQTPQASSATRYQYDNEGNRTQLTDPDSNVIKYAYDAGYRMTTLQFSMGVQYNTVSYQYDPRGLVLKRTDPNGVVSTYGYDVMSRMTSLTHVNSSSVTLFSFVWQYDQAGNLTQENSNRWDIGLSATVPWEIVYGYDARYQLTSETYYKNTNFYLEMQYTYDPAGNRTKLVTTNPNTSNSPVTTTSSYYADNQIEQSVQSGPQQATVTTNYGEDKNGNLTSANSSSAGNTTYSYDFENRLKLVDLPAGTTVQFGYNPDGLRVQKTGTTGVVTDYVLDGLQVLLEKNASGATQTRYVPALATIVSGDPSYYLEDRMGSILGLANSSQSVTDTFVYEAWGNTIQRQGTNNSPIQWIGHFGYYEDTDIDISIIGVRFYDSKISRFLTRDPVDPSIFNTNCYSYVNNYPLIFVDPTGMFWWIVIIAGAALISGCSGGKSNPKPPTAPPLPMPAMPIQPGRGLGGRPAPKTSKKCQKSATFTPSILTCGKCCSDLLDKNTIKTFIDLQSCCNDCCGSIKDERGMGDATDIQRCKTACSNAGSYHIK
jgi:RHS repeat-associated protein